jgi:hypothetical protein
VVKIRNLNYELSTISSVSFGEKPEPRKSKSKHKHNHKGSSEKFINSFRRPLNKKLLPIETIEPEEGPQPEPLDLSDKKKYTDNLTVEKIDELRKDVEVK